MSNDTFGMNAEQMKAQIQPVLGWVELSQGTFPLRELRGEEAMSRPFRFEARLRIEQATAVFDPDEVVGTEGVLRITRGDTLRRIRFVVSEASLEAVAGGNPEISLVLEAPLGLLRYRRDMRVFRNRTVPEIVAQVLDGMEIRSDFRLASRYEVRPYTVQHRESDLDFVHRLLEDEGIHYFFEDAAEDDGSSAHVAYLVFGDHADYHPIGGVSALPFRPGSALGRGSEIVQQVGARAAMAPSRVSLRDFNPEAPALAMDVSAEGPCPAGVEHYDFPGRYSTPDRGADKARLVAESFACESSVVQGRSDSARLRPGARFSLLDGPPEVPDGDYVVTRVRYGFVRDEDSWLVDFEALPAATVFRPARVTPSPRIVNPLVGHITGPEGADIHTDPLGRVKVHFPWDRLQHEDDQASHWVPVFQDNTGGSFAIPRVGWESLVHFVEGDPDRPVVMGRLYNPEEPFPEPLPEGKTRSTFKSLSSPGRDGANEIRTDDLAGSELVYLQAEKDQKVHVANDKTENVLDTEEVRIVGDETIDIGANFDFVVGVDRTLTVESDQATKVGAARSRAVKKDETADIAGSHSLVVGGTHLRRIATTDSLACKSLRETIGGFDLEASLKTNATKAGYAETQTVGGALLELARGKKTEACESLRAETVGGLLCTSSGKALRIRAEQSRTTTVGAALRVSGKVGVVLHGASSVSLSTALSGKVEGAQSITIKVGDSIVSLTANKVSIATTGNITIDAGKAALASSEAQLNPPGG